MNLSKLFELQRQLDEHIEREHPVQEGEDRLAKKILALQVELGELANEWRGFKFWSNDQEPRIGKKKVCTSCNGKGQKEMASPHTNWKLKLCECGFCQGTGYWIIQRNTLLEEYVDCLHFILSIGLELKLTDWKPHFSSVAVHFGGNELITQFEEVFWYASSFGAYTEDEKDTWYSMLFSNFLGLGKMLGFTWEQIEQMYMEKNRINHERQESNY